MADQAPAPENFQITLRRSLPQPLTLDVSGSDTLATLKDAIQARTGAGASGQRLSFGQVALTDDTMTLSEYGIGPGSIIVLAPVMRKPVIYIYPPVETEVSVKLSLIPEWRFSVLYPAARVAEGKYTSSQANKQAEWTVQARPNGTLTVLDGDHSGVDAAYLFWEAEPTNSTVDLPDSPPASPIVASPASLSGDEAFIPGRTRCYPSDSVLLEAKHIPGYLEKALKALTLNTEARTSFITFWLPFFLRHRYVALKFVSQKSFERAAPLDITPRPDVVTRIFMLFQGVKEGDVAAWEEATSRSQEPPELWREVVGIEEKEVARNIFRVVEWGGMEV